ncbi:MAG TPA: acyl-CoA dehydrogenase family protein [Acidimicrobiia bacterium]|nr:acyl-CoA dehydrogenase family protein [Acidimicrobiia bacterium]
MRQTAVTAELGIELDDADHTFLDELGAWLDDHLPADRPPRDPGARVAWLRDWQAELDRGRWVAPSWPTEYGGRAATPLQQLLYHVEMNRRRVPMVIGQIGLNLCGATLITHGTAEQRDRFLPPMRSAEELWAQGFSEPGAGSDLASLRTRGVVEGDDLLITGQKIWTTGAHIADWLFALVRTDPTAPKRDGISFVLIPLSAEGITIRPIRQISGDAEFNEVFLDEVRVPLTNVVGRLGDGWLVTRTTLANERAVLFMGQQLALRRLVDDIVGAAICAGPGGRRAADDPALRERIARAWAAAQLVRVNGIRNLGRVLTGGEPGPEGAMSKLFGQEAEQRLHELALDVGGTAALLDRDAPGAHGNGKWALGWLRTRASTIGGGTSEIQRNILAERVLGQPRDPWADA